MWLFLILNFVTKLLKGLCEERGASTENWYVHPPECHPYIYVGPTPDGIYLTCNLPSIHYDTNFQAIVPERLFALYINCTVSDLGSSLLPSALLHLHLVEELQFHNCRFYNMPPGTLANMTHLSTLVIDGLQRHDFSLPEKFLENNPVLSIIQLGNDGIHKLPPDLLCPTPQLMILSLPGNELKSLNDIGCSNNSICCQNVQALNLSRNAITELRKAQLQLLVKIQLFDLHLNSITLVEEGAFDSMLNLDTLDLSDNRIPSLPANLFKNNLVLQRLDIGGNHLSIMSPELCCSHLKSLLLFGLGNNNLTVLPAKMLIQSQDLVLVELSDNPIQVIPNGFFDDQHKLIQLNLVNCQIENLPDRIFHNLHSLDTLLLMNNKLQSVNSSVLQGLYMLQYLDLSGNVIASIHEDAFQHCPQLLYLDFHNNRLKSFPSLQAVQHIEFFNLSRNQISEVEATGSISKSLKKLDLSYNQIKSLSSPMCATETSTLEFLDLSFNQITTIHPTVLNVCLALHTLLLNHNQFVIFDGRISKNLPSLQVLNLSHNRLKLFDYNLAPMSLEYLDISNNQIEVLDDSQNLVGTLKMKTLMASHNKIKRLAKDCHPVGCLPVKLHYVDLSSNAIQVLQGSVFDALLDLTEADLSNNLLTELNRFSFSLYSRRNLTSLPTVILSGNMPNCTCSLKWLIDYKYVPGDLDIVRIIKPDYCWATHERVRKIKTLINMKSQSDLLNRTLTCPYYAEIPGISPACMKACFCYHDESKHYFDIDCGQRTWNPSEDIKLTHLTTQLFLDGNTNVQAVANTILIQVPKLKTLFMNGSHIEALNNQQFKGLHELDELHLENNLLVTVSGIEFEELYQLKKLFLHDNLLKTVNIEALQNLPSLQQLTLHRNKLSMFTPQRAVNISYITLRENPFECTCSFSRVIQLWARRIDDLNYIQCRDTVTNTNFSAYNDSYCQEEANSVYQGKTTAILATVSGLLFVVMCIVIFMYIYRLEMQVWLYSRYGVRLFHNNDKQDENKMFDAFISYSSEDDEFVARELVGRLEQKLQFKLCIHQRDFLVGGYIADTIVEAVEKSCRTLIVLTENFVASEWCRFEFKMAHHRSMQDRCCRLIIIILDDVDPALMDKELKLYLQTNTYLRWGDSLFWEKLIFAMPNRVPVKPPSVSQVSVLANS